MSKPLLLIDSYAQIFRSFYAVRALTDSKGQPSNAIFAMMRFLLNLQNDYPETGWDGVFVFDMGRPQHRMTLAPAYKANRAPTPPELTAQLPCIRAMIEAFGWQTIQQENWEADDLIGGLSKHFSDRKVRILSADKDLAQLVDQRVEMFVPDHTGKGFCKRGCDEVSEKFGVPPALIVDYLAMIGDAADNIPGVEGVGPKTAAKLLNQFGSIDAMLANSAAIERESLRTRIAASSELLKTNIALVRLVCEKPEGAIWNDAAVCRREPDYAAICRIAKEHDLHSLEREITGKLASVGPSLSDVPQTSAAPVKKEDPAPSSELEQPDLFA